MSFRLTRQLIVGALAAALPLSVLPLAGCTSDSPREESVGVTNVAAVPAPALRLVAFDSCEQLVADLRRAAREAVGPYGFLGADMRAQILTRNGARTSIADAASAKQTAPTSFSGTNTHEQGVDEPDIVKTDGTRIVTVDEGVLRVVDAATHRQTGRLQVGPAGFGETQLLLAGDRALVLIPARFSAAISDGVAKRAEEGARKRAATIGPELVLVGLAGKPTVLSRYQLDDGSLVDARMTGQSARVVIRSSPRITLPVLPDKTSDESRVQANRKAVDAAPIDAWLPRYKVVTAGVDKADRIGCDRVSRPTTYSGTSLVTVLSFDLRDTGAGLGDGDPVGVLADGDVVYGTGTSLYVANDLRWRGDMWRDIARTEQPQRTEIYRFDTTAAGHPTYAASGTVPGRLLNQYALSEWDGHLRVATTVDQPTVPSDQASKEPDTATSAAPDTSSAIRVLRQNGDKLVEVGAVDGLGKGERIYSVRFIGPRGYVVTFRQTDPLYSVDLGDPAKPVVTGELKINGYSAHLQPAGDGRLIGIGQDVDANGRIKGTQLSLFDVTDPAKPRRIAQHQVAGGQSEAEYDPHALLWWQATGLLVVPMTVFDQTGRVEPKETALALRVGEAALTPAGSLVQPPNGDQVPSTVRRTLVVGDTLWTMSQAGLQARDLASLQPVAWVAAT